MSETVPEWMAASNRKAAEVGFGTFEYWLWVNQSLGQLCESHANDRLVMAIAGVLQDWLEEQQKLMEVSYAQKTN